ncbi:hypothetical protein SBW85_07050 [Vibrio plantisponsor]|uniref:Lipoprotein n=1 Tax=Vibrio plantisponsor TaxID=664643 RepID=A0ABU4IG47_9VIBR|nr:hypothetical protein [Vibrio plantisponsor]MDW6017533.1 hypothetical protein [Vibrio plantisponsor]NNM40369.1 hypothetical protein [Vibrio plantisponsor]
MQQKTTVLLAVSLIFTSPLSWACSYDGQFSNPFTESYPGALDVAIATQQALKSNLITSPPSLSGGQGLRRVTWWLQLMAKMPIDIPNGTYIYLVDSQLWSQYKSTNSIDIHVIPPSDEAIVVQMTETTLHNLVNKKITFLQAKELGLALQA